MHYFANCHLFWVIRGVYFLCTLIIMIVISDSSSGHPGISQSSQKVIICIDSHTYRNVYAIIFKILSKIKHELMLVLLKCFMQNNLYMSASMQRININTCTDNYQTVLLYYGPPHVHVHWGPLSSWRINQNKKKYYVNTMLTEKFKKWYFYIKIISYVNVWCITQHLNFE